MVNVWKIVVAYEPGARQSAASAFLSALAEIQTIATICLIEGLTLWPAIGWSRQWGREKTVVIETTAEREIAREFVLCILAEFVQTAAYVTCDGAAAELWQSDGEIETLSAVLVANVPNEKNHYCRFCGEPTTVGCACG